MFLRGLMVFLVVAYASADLCCFPEKFRVNHYTNGVLKQGNQLLSFGCNSSTIYSSRRSVVSSDCEVLSPRPAAQIRVIQDYNKGKAYTYYPKFKYCKVADLPDRAYKCIPDGKEISSEYFGDRRSASYLMKTYDVKINNIPLYLTLGAKALKEKKCNLVGITLVNVPGLILETTGYTNYTIGVKDDSVFDIPKACKKGYLDDKLRFHDDAKSLDHLANISFKHL